MEGKQARALSSRMGSARQICQGDAKNQNREQPAPVEVAHQSVNAEDHS